MKALCILAAIVALACCLSVAATASSTGNPIVDIVNGRHEAQWNKRGYYKCMCCDGLGYVKGKPEGK